MILHLHRHMQVWQEFTGTSISITRKLIFQKIIQILFLFFAILRFHTMISWQMHILLKGEYYRDNNKPEKLLKNMTKPLV